VIYRNIYWRNKKIPYVRKKDYIWSIGIYTGDSPFNLTPHNNFKKPVLTANDVTDVQADFVADPFMVKENNTWYMFFEVMNSKTKQGQIGLATSIDGLSWTYKQIILNEPLHLSYPYTFKWKNEYYMIPDTTEAEEVRLYKAIEFPTQWTFVKALLKGHRADSSILFFNNRWWIFASTNPGRNDTLSLYYADNLMGPWFEHPNNPIIAGNAHISRPGGRVIIFDGGIIRFAQDDSPIYGNAVRAFEIIDLTTETYKEKEVPGNPLLKATGHGWNKRGMHQIDPHQLNNGKWIACVDGFNDSLVFGMK
jgi:hypothetical protein